MEEKMKEVLDKKLSTSWNGLTTESDIKNNFSVEGELVVTITLNEYRNLIRIAATTNAMKQELEEEKRKLTRERDDAKSQLETLRELIKNSQKEGEEEY